MFGIELCDARIHNFDYFAIDLKSDGKFVFNKEEFWLGEFTKDLCNLSKEYITDLLMLSGELNVIRKKLLVNFGYQRPLFVDAKNKINEILNFVKTVKPFSYFNIESSRNIVNDVFSNANLNLYDHMFFTGIQYIINNNVQENFNYANALITVYCYFGNDVANFTTAAISYTATLMTINSRQKDDLATVAFNFFANEEMVNNMKNSNPFKDMEGVNLRPRVTQVPTIKLDKNNKPFITRRLYFGRLMDFFITELFEAMQCGHYLWQCGVCKKYFLMTTAHKQLYCHTVNEEYGVPCAYVAKHPEITKTKLEKESKKDGPLYDIWRRRNNSIRKNKSLGKYSDAVSAEAKRIIDDKFELAQIDFVYAKEQYEKDMNLKLIYDEAVRNVE